MKLSFKKDTPEYIGNEYAEYKYADFFKEISLSETLEYRKNTIEIDFSNTYLYKFIISENKNIAKLSKIEKDILSAKVKRISKVDYSTIEQIINSYPELDQNQNYINDFALLVAYTKKECSLGMKESIERSEKFYSKSLRGKIRKFFSNIVDEKIDVVNITIEYNKDKFGNSKKLVIDSSLLIKMMLYQFAKRYFILFQKRSEENWEKYIKEENNLVVTEKTKRGRPQKYNTKILRDVIQLYWNFISNQSLLQNASLYRKYQLIGELICLAGGYLEFDEYCKHNEDKEATTYKSKNDYHYKRLKKIWKPEGT